MGGDDERLAGAGDHRGVVTAGLELTHAGREAVIDGAGRVLSGDHAGETTELLHLLDDGAVRAPFVDGGEVGGSGVVDR
ncbi:hypothetical protein [Brachybacterium huguangmaarense]